MYEIDGSVGGGSILRIAVPIALAQEEDIRVESIRKNRSNPGLRPQHLKGIELICELTGSQLEGGEIGSSWIEIKAGSAREAAANINIETAGSVSLVYQLLSNYCMMADTAIDVVFNGGGTYTKWSPNFDYLKQVTLPALELFGQKSELTVNRVGYYPKGDANGLISVNQLNPPTRVELDIAEGRPAIQLISRATDHLQEARVAERQIQGVLNEGIQIEEHWIYYDESSSTGTALTAWMIEEGAVYRGFSVLGEKGVKAETIGKRLADQIMEFQEPAAVDNYLADQLMVALAQSDPGSYYTIPQVTKHVTTNLDLINSMLNNVLTLQHHSNYYLLQRV